MEALVKLITEKTGISNEQATTAVNVVAGFLKDKMPGGLGNQVDGFIKTGKVDTAGLADELKNKLGGMFGK